MLKETAANAWVAWVPGLRGSVERHREGNDNGKLTPLSMFFSGHWGPEEQKAALPLLLLVVAARDRVAASLLAGTRRKTSRPIRESHFVDGGKKRGSDGGV